MAMFLSVRDRRSGRSTGRLATRRYPRAEGATHPMQCWSKSDAGAILCIGFMTACGLRISAPRLIERRRVSPRLAARWANEPSVIGRLRGCPRQLTDDQIDLDRADAHHYAAGTNNRIVEEHIRSQANIETVITVERWADNYTVTAPGYCV